MNKAVTSCCRGQTRTQRLVDYYLLAKGRFFHMFLPLNLHCRFTIFLHKAKDFNLRPENWVGYSSSTARPVIPVPGLNCAYFTLTIKGSVRTLLKPVMMALHEFKNDWLCFLSTQRESISGHVFKDFLAIYHSPHKVSFIFS